MKKIALITGATSGIGKAIAVMLAEHQYNLIITGRRKDRLDALKTELGMKYKSDVLSLCFDVRVRQEVERVVSGLPVSWRKIDVLVNNAGLAAGLAPIDSGDVDDWDQMIDTNLKGLLYITRQVAPLMIANGRGHIVNITSIAAKDAYPQGNVYCASKAAVETLTKGMRIDLLPHGIKVSSIAPGMVDTEFSLVRFKGDKERADKVYEHLTPLSAADVADAVWYVVSRPLHVCVNDMLLMPTAQATATITHRAPGV